MVAALARQPTSDAEAKRRLDSRSPSSTPTDATYGWNYGPDDTSWPSAATRSASIALGLEMGGLDGWTYPYQEIRDRRPQGHVIGFWKQVADATRDRRRHLRGGRHRRQLVPLRRRLQVVWQRDFFDHGNAASCSSR